MFVKSKDEKPELTSRLLSLPAELQLSIWEFTLTSQTPLLINCPCDSSYGGWTEEYYSDRELWETGIKQPPWQPGLLRTCTQVRADAVKIFYTDNTFQAGYCYECDTDIVMAWLRVIGEVNRRRISGRMVFFDANRRHDRNMPKDLKLILRSEVVREMGGRIESEYDKEGCRHVVTFGDHGEEDLEALEGLFKEEDDVKVEMEVRSVSRQLTSWDQKTQISIGVRALGDQVSDCSLSD